MHELLLNSVAFSLRQPPPPSLNGPNFYLVGLIQFSKWSRPCFWVGNTAVTKQNLSTENRYLKCLSNQLVTNLKNCLSNQSVTNLKNCLSNQLETNLKNCLSNQLVTNLKNCLSNQLETNLKNCLSNQLVTNLKNCLSNQPNCLI